ncbi:MAG TPA: hypothetical protein VEN81_02870 [Planctomycetota bacterium]|nr:hypothetical protein [Planctomycetota bacterium]
MNLAPVLFFQEKAKGSDFWSKLLGIDRVQIPDGAEWSVNWHHMPPLWVLCLVILPAILGFAALVYRLERRDVGPGPKVVMTLFRSLALVLIALLLMGPVLTVETIKSRKAYIIVLLDESRSMQKVDLIQTDADREAIGKVTGETGAKEISQLSRAEIVKKALQNPKLKILDELEDKLNVAYFTFSSTASAKESRDQLLKDYSRDSCIGTETAIGDAIKSALNTLKGQYIAGVVIFTDGKNNAGIATKEIAVQCRQRYLPIYAVAAGLPRTPKDIALMELEAPDAVLANNELKVAFKVSSFGYDKETVKAELFLYPAKDKEKDPGNDPKELDRMIEESKKEGEADITLTGQKQADLKIVFNPKTPGEYFMILRIPPRIDENTPFNNYLVHRIRVADDKIKVLYVEHPPRYEYRFLKNALVRDTKLLAHCFLTSADEGFPQEHTKSEDPMFREPLQEFPKDLKSLLEFDVVIYGDVDPGKLGPDAAKHLESFVTEFGGGIIFISGMMYNPRSLAGTPLANLLPVVADDTRDPYEHEKVYDAEYGYVLTPDGQTSPVTNFKEFGGNQSRNTEHWEDRAGRGDGMLRLRWFNRVKKLKAGASPLVEVRVENEPTRPPLFVTMHAGRGRVFWSATDETWLWRKLVGDYPWFYPFWQQAMNWTREGKLLGARRYRVNVDKDRYTRGEKVKIYVNAWDETYAPRTDPFLDVFIDHPTRTERVKIQLKKDSTKDGYYEGDYIPDETGPFKVWSGGEDEASRASAKFVVFIPDREDDEPILDINALKEMASESDRGQYFQIDQVDQLNRAIQASRNQIRETKETDLWDSPMVYLLFALFMTAEWILRKIFRML